MIAQNSAPPLSLTQQDKDIEGEQIIADKLPVVVPAIKYEDFTIVEDESNTSVVVDNRELPLSVKSLLATQAFIKSRMGKEISFASPLLMNASNPIIFPFTINILQGQTGVHKSRVAADMSVALLHKYMHASSLGFKRNGLLDVYLLYADTERNQKDQLPYALQQIVLQSGYTIDALPDNFSFISLLDINRKIRFTALKNFIEHLRSITNKHLFIIVDVITDCICDFNGTGDTMELIDMMNAAINNYDCTFLCIIHENPGTEKARGHVGSESSNKSSTSIQVSFVKQANKPTDVIEIKFLKTRSSAKPESILCKYSDLQKGLVPLENQSDKNQDELNRDKKRAEIKQLAKDLFPPTSALRNVEYIKAYIAKTTKHESTAKRDLKLMEAFDFVIKGNDGLYRINMSDELKTDDSQF